MTPPTLDEKIVAIATGFANYAVSLRTLAMVFAAKSLPDTDSSTWRTLMSFWEKFLGVVVLLEVIIVVAIGTEFVAPDHGAGAAVVYTSSDNTPDSHNYVITREELMRRIRRVGREMHDIC
ncbi:hypothetical protein M427DRAFT_33411 [Gonapodya prolifera JEL478]|uniref:Uncharacterized protein n=1 Tax=Gonapodya prolifera (strain JEL478) TaxID=1344416 RepID=A0A139ABF5_GONPJ|nr:hypothetical protein M427DRAFT_33411 [Gonapodya prolifera JEL478]|eukprot:KXS13974.1 hypothetical protein M427DRAFT_33411 [Gonapodya prolifera JEL478]